MSEHNHEWEWHHEWWGAHICECGAVRESPPVDPAQDRPGIDVDRLSEAIFNATTSRGHAEHDSEECETCRWFRTLSNEVADDAAREYARLSEHPDTGDASQP